MIADQFLKMYLFGPPVSSVFLFLSIVFCGGTELSMGRRLSPAKLSSISSDGDGKFVAMIALSALAPCSGTFKAVVRYALRRRDAINSPSVVIASSADGFHGTGFSYG